MKVVSRIIFVLFSVVLFAQEHPKLTLTPERFNTDDFCRQVFFSSKNKQNKTDQININDKNYL